MELFDQKRPEEKLSLNFPFNLVKGELVLSVSSSVVVLRGVDANPSALLSGIPVAVKKIATQLVVGGLNGVVYKVTITATTSMGQVLISSGILPVVSEAQSSGLFIRELDLPTFISGTMAIAADSYDVLSELSEDILWSKLVASEADIAHRLGIFMAPTEVFTSQPTQEQIDSLNGGAYIVEPGYDLPPNFFTPEIFGCLQLRQLPVISISSIDLIYPNQGGMNFTIPPSWIKLDNKYGQLHLFPSAQSISAPLSVMTMQAIGGGYNIPHMIRIRYTAGLVNAHVNYPDVIDLVYRNAVLRMLHDSFLPDSGSASIDGLSMSISADLSKRQGEVDDIINTLKQSLIGQVWGVL